MLTRSRVDIIKRACESEGVYRNFTCDDVESARRLAVVIGGIDVIYDSNTKTATFYRKSELALKSDPYYPKVIIIPLFTNIKQGWLNKAVQWLRSSNKG